MVRKVAGVSLAMLPWAWILASVIPTAKPLMADLVFRASPAAIAVWLLLIFVDYAASSTESE